MDSSYTDNTKQEFLLNTTVDLTSNIMSSTYVQNFWDATTPNNCSACSDDATEARNKYGFPYSTGVQVFLAMITFLIALGAVTGNLIILVTISMTKRLRTLNSAFLLNLSASDLLIGAIVIPFVLYSLIDKRTGSYEKVSIFIIFFFTESY